MDAFPRALFDALAPVTIVCGHYGVGKTNFAVNLACDLAHMGKRVTMVDLDVVNPYFRATEQRSYLEAAGVSIIAPVFAERGSSLDAPSLRGSIVPAMENARKDAVGDTYVIVDAGGDDAGVTALGRFAAAIRAGGYAMLYVVNRMRNQTHEAGEAFRILCEIECASRLEATAIVDNTHLKNETTSAILASSSGFCRALCAASGLPLAGKTIPASASHEDAINEAVFSAFYGDGFENDIFYPVESIVKSPWE